MTTETTLKKVSVPYELRTPGGLVQVWPMGDGQWQWRTHVPDHYSSVAKGLSPSKGNAILAGLSSLEGAPEVGADFIHPNWTELFDSPEAYLEWREAQGAA